MFAGQIKAQIKAGFSSDVSSGCSPLLVNFKNESTGIDDNTAYYWDLGNGSTPSQEKNPSALFLNSSTGSITYTIKLVIKSSTGADSVTKKSYITVYASPKVSFTTNVSQGCPPLNVKFTDATKAGSGTIKSWLWDFGEGQLSDKQNPSATYHYSNTYSISLSVENSFGCKQTSDGSAMIHVLDTVNAGFDYYYTNICQSPAPVNFVNASQSATTINTYNWNFGDGQTANTSSPTHTFESKGTYQVNLIAKNKSGCADTTIQSITIGKAGADFTYTNVCANSAVQFTDASSAVPTSSAWTFGDGTTSKVISPTHVYAMPGTYTVTLQADFGSCIGSITKKITVVTRPHASFTASSSGVCKVPYPVTFTNNTTGADTYQWLFGDGKISTDKSTNIMHTYTEGFYDVTLIATAGTGCSDTSIQTNVVKLGPPQIDSIQNLPIKGCIPQAVTPIPFITTAEPIVKYSWDFGDGTASTEENPQHIYTKVGSYTVSLIVFTSSGCSDTFVTANAAKIGIAPKAAFSANPLNTCALISVNFRDSTQGDVTNWLWKFGDGGESNLKNTTHHYLDTGWFSVTLISSNLECKDSVTIDKYVYIKAPVALYQSSFNCALPYDRTFTDQSIAAKTWLWDFGDGTNSSEPSPVHTFAKTGTYIVKLKVTNDECFDTLQVKMQVVDEHPAFTYDYSSKPACRNDLITFTATNINPDNISSYNWIYGDSTSSLFKGVVSSTHKYTKTGTFIPQLITKDILGCQDTVIDKTGATIYGPTAGFGNDSGACINATVMFHDSTKTDGMHALQKWEWAYEPNDAQSYTNAASYAHQYTKEGYYDITLKVYDSYGCKDSITKAKALQITNPKALFSVNDSLICAKNNVSFTDSSTGEKLSYSWSWGDNTSSGDTAGAVVHSYVNEGIYSVSLFVTDKFKCKSDTTINNAIIISNPKAIMVINGPTSTTCPPLLVTPVSHSLHAQSLSWNFGDGSITKIDTPSHNYIMGGDYDLMLIAKGFGECYDTAHQAIKLKGPSGIFSYNPLVHCNPSTVSFTCETKNAVKVTWDFNDGVVTPDNGSHTASHVYKNNGKYLPKLLMTDKDGCFVGLENLDTLYISGAKADYVATSQATCDSSLAAFAQTSVPYYDEITTYQWSFGDGAISTQANPEHYYTKSGTYQAKLSVATKAGCTDSVERAITVTVHKTPRVTLVAPDSVCVQSSVLLYGSDSLNQEGNTWRWSFGDNISDSGGSRIYHKFMDGGLHHISAIVTTPFGCIDSAAALLQAIALPNISLGPDSFVCSGSTMMLQPKGAAIYSWQNDNSLSCTNCATPIAAPSVNTSYIVTGANQFGCAASDSIALEVIKPQTISVNNDTLCLGENKELEASGADLYSWSPALYLDNSTIANPKFHAAIDTAIVYTVTGMDRKKCFSDTKLVTVKVYPIPHIEIQQKDIDLNVGFSTQISMKSSEDVTQWRWEPQTFLSDASIESPVASPKQTITYSCVASNNGSCFARDQVTIHITCNNANMFVPNTFSPNKDGVNDKFFPRGTGVFNIKSLRVFNRWGEVVFERDNFLPNSESDGWDGTFKGQPLSSDVYVYMLDIICENNTVIPFKGNVTLVR